jgi:hypothetical protein
MEDATIKAIDHKSREIVPTIASYYDPRTQRKDLTYCHFL